MNGLRGPWLLLVYAAALGCGGTGSRHSPAAEAPAPGIRRLALPPVVNKTGQFGLEDALMLRVRDEFLRDGRCPLLPEAQADGLARITITRYLNTPIQYDAGLVPTAYKLRVVVDLELVNKRQPGQPVWTDKGLEGIETYAAPNLAGGMSEEQARDGVWDTLARDIVARFAAGAR